MDIMYKDTISAQIHSEEWKINMILEIVDYFVKTTLHMMYHYITIDDVIHGIFLTLFFV